MPSLENSHPANAAKISPISHAEMREIASLKSRRNARSHDQRQIAQLAKSMVEFGWTNPVLIDEFDTILAGYGRVEAAQSLGIAAAPVLVARGWSDAQKRAYMLADNQIALQAGWDEDLLRLELEELKLLDFDLSLIGFPEKDLSNLFSLGTFEPPIGSLTADFILPPFSVLDARSGWWQSRKRAWLALGLQSELGRVDNALRFSDTILEPDRKKRNSKVSHSKVDLNLEGLPEMEATPIERGEGDVYLKRDDLFQIAGVRGGKVRTCWHLAQGAKGLVTAGSRSSPQVNIVAHIAREISIPCRVHTPTGALSPEVRQAQDCGAEVIQHKAGYNNVIIARAREDAARHGWTNIPFGMECSEAVRQTAAQFLASELPPEIERIVVPVGSGMSLAGILAGMAKSGCALPVLGVLVGADPFDRLDRYAPGWRNRCELVRSALAYDEPALKRKLGDIPLDSIYEAKCLPMLRPHDLFWLIGLRATQAP